MTFSRTSKNHPLNSTRMEVWIGEAWVVVVMVVIVVTMYMVHGHHFVPRGDNSSHRFAETLAGRRNDSGHASRFAEWYVRNANAVVADGKCRWRVHGKPVGGKMMRGWSRNTRFTVGQVSAGRDAWRTHAVPIVLVWLVGDTSFGDYVWWICKRQANKQ